MAGGHIFQVPELGSAPRREGLWVLECVLSGASFGFVVPGGFAAR